jgi:hypothetical protein
MSGLRQRRPSGLPGGAAAPAGAALAPHGGLPRSSSVLQRARDSTGNADADALLRERFLEHLGFQVLLGSVVRPTRAAARRGARPDAADVARSRRDPGAHGVRRHRRGERERVAAPARTPRGRHRAAALRPRRGRRLQVPVRRARGCAAARAGRTWKGPAAPEADAGGGLQRHGPYLPHVARAARACRRRCSWRPPAGRGCCTCWSRLRSA